MALDKLVDSSKLNAALTATAQAIRDKTGTSDLIPWDAETGFKTTVEAIAAANGSGGGSLVINRGSFTGAGINTVSHGLSVVPSFIIAYCYNASGNTPRTTYGIGPDLLSVYTSNNIRVAFGSGMFNIPKYDFTQSYGTDTDQYMYGAIREVNANTFVIGSNGSTGATYNTTYQFIAIGLAE